MKLTLASVLVVATVLTGVTGCVAGPDPEKSEFAGRAPLASCGELKLAQGESVPAQAWDCLEAGVATGAEFVVAKLTTEGDPITYYFRVGPKIGGVDIFIDSTQDKWGSGKWDRRLCTGEDFATIIAGCVATFVPVEG
ncbi:hypothetical protein SAMN05216410_2865 [Sanguibacter gelidistatuariae]|uniref:Uncharacterized protein n=1 Tax=Sanguibacter gelidistatuariae TaxID=1814289 RepID=A0A1G6S3H4_9MICO|nr:hypothetical protein [Sanguibacter gelidistatuariae]SDD11408.1 hypothetical protein SAMN05216410_2865 [Sanguibacter gelidistatuariae]